MNIKGAIFDLDGTLIDSMEMWAHAASKYVTGRGVKLDDPDALDAVAVTMGTCEYARLLKDRFFPDDDIDYIVKTLDESVEQTFLNEIPLKEGADEFLKALYEIGVKMCVATASPRELVEGILKKYDLLKYFECIVTSQEVGSSKKDSADIFERALSLIGTSKADTLIFEDAIYALRPALRAGFKSAGMYDSHAADTESEMKENCLYYFYNWQEAKEALV
ncbi:MAG: HAD family phosphatase [Oscillospiraceae bacterium]|nr:HAD family phosphatase [Oscillospiraceae bacterium]